MLGEVSGPNRALLPDSFKPGDVFLLRGRWAATWCSRTARISAAARAAAPATATARTPRSRATAKCDPAGPCNSSTVTAVHKPRRLRVTLLRPRATAHGDRAGAHSGGAPGPGRRCLVPLTTTARPVTGASLNRFLRPSPAHRPHSPPSSVPRASGGWVAAVGRGVRALEVAVSGEAREGAGRCPGAAGA